jgi:eukaryotic-like serine/threonine-protein kinase
MDGGEAELEIPAPNPNGVGPTSWLPDGSAVVVGLFFPSTFTDVFLFPLNRGKPRPLVSLPGADDHARVSPNGRWLAYHSDEKGQTQVFVTSLPHPGPRIQVSVRGGGTPRWSRDGRRLYFVETANANQPGPIMAVSVTEGGDGLRFGPPRQASSLLQGISAPNYDIHPDGRILALKRMRAAPSDNDAVHAILVTGWREELARLMSERRR